MRIYFGLTGTGGKVLGSCEVGDVYEVKSHLAYNGDGIDVKFNNEMKMEYCDYGYEKLAKMGYINQKHKYAIEIKDFREEQLNVTDLVSLKFCNVKCIVRIERLPNKFCKIVEPKDVRYNAILMSITIEEFHMIKSGEKKYLFIKRLPKMLREEKEYEKM